MIRRTGILSMIALSIFLFCGQTAPQQCADNQPPPNHTGAEVAGIAILTGVVVGTIVLVHVHNSHHRVQGCVTATPDGIRVLNEGDQKTYMLKGVTSDLKVGDRVKVHGDRVKQNKGDTGDQVFVVEKLNKDFGACKIPAPVIPAE